MIAHVTGGKALPQEIADQITDRTDGVPLFIEELTKAVVESGLLVEAGDRYVVTGPVTPWRSRHRSRRRSWRGLIAWRQRETWRRSPPLSDVNSPTS